MRDSVTDKRTTGGQVRRGAGGVQVRRGADGQRETVSGDVQLLLSSTTQDTPAAAAAYCRLRLSRYGYADMWPRLFGC